MIAPLNVAAFLYTPRHLTGAAVGLLALIRNEGCSFGVTLVQDTPRSRETCTCPSLVPAQISPASLGDSVSAKITPAYSTPMLSGVSPPESCWRLLSLEFCGSFFARRD